MKTKRKTSSGTGRKVWKTRNGLWAARKSGKKVRYGFRNEAEAKYYCGLGKKSQKDLKAMQAEKVWKT